MRMILILLVCLGVVQAAENPDETSLKEIRSAYELALDTGDITSLKPFFAEKMELIPMTGRTLKSMEDVETYFKEMRERVGKEGEVRSDLKPTMIDFYGDVAMACGTSNDYVRDASGVEYDFGAFWTAFFVKEKNGWKVVRWQKTLNPVDNVFVDRQIKVSRVQYGVGGLVVGTVLTLIFSMIFSGIRSSRKS